eukprot:TRINITY_DN463_c0_g1_i6.p1 TRINITY_DN463_c0_g1~~TRINITY_DN463_c0_g1_i6.p1  ORF type:complete len:153 (+),score=57.60 TRINITY_DN463_c0_g1_i6:862-1320(+)
MLFVLRALRARVLQKNVPEAEYYLEMMAKAWQRSVGQVHMCTLIFDETSTFRMDFGFQVCSARPTFKTSDDALIHWAQGIPVPERHRVVVFTSDRALTETLEKIGVRVIKSKMWFNMAASKLSLDECVSSLDEWADKWISQTFQQPQPQINN